MTAWWWILISGLGAGMIHALGPDHCAAMASLMTQTNKEQVSNKQLLSSSTRVSLSFGTGHGLTLTLCVILCSALGWIVPSSLESTLEKFGGTLLILMGLWMISGIPRPSTVMHSHTLTSWAVGGLLSLSGIRSLLLLLIPLASQKQAWFNQATYILAFGVGIVLTMLVFGLLYAKIRNIHPRSLDHLAAFISVALGIFWVTTA